MSLANEIPAWLDRQAWNVKLLTRRWQRARPFPHVVIDSALAPERLAELRLALEAEPTKRTACELREARATAESFEQTALGRFATELGCVASLTALTAISGKRLKSVALRGYQYRTGHYLLPHTGHDLGDYRQLAFALCLDISDDLVGGERELFECALEEDEVVGTDPGGKISPKPGQLLLIDVSCVSLHQIREVECGSLSLLTGWWLP